MGGHVRHLLRERCGHPPGCLLLDFATRRMSCRDRWIGWRPGTYRRQLRLVVRNARDLLFPWVRVRCLGSHALRAARHLPGDWERLHGCRPVLLEIHVGPRCMGTCHRAANWQRIGETGGRPADGGTSAKARKQVYAHPLQRDCRTILLKGAERAGRWERTGMMESLGHKRYARELAAARSESQRLRLKVQAAKARRQAAQARIAWPESRLEALLHAIHKSKKPVGPSGKEDIAALHAQPYRLPRGAIMQSGPDV